VGWRGQPASLGHLKPSRAPITRASTNAGLDERLATRQLLARSVHPALAEVAEAAASGRPFERVADDSKMAEEPIDRVPRVTACTQIQPRRPRLAPPISRPHPDKRDSNRRSSETTALIDEEQPTAGGSDCRIVVAQGAVPLRLPLFLPIGSVPTWLQ
jgi:hypothetical protein